MLSRTVTSLRSRCVRSGALRAAPTSGSGSQTSLALVLRLCAQLLLRNWPGSDRRGAFVDCPSRGGRRGSALAQLRLIGKPPKFGNFAILWLLLGCFSTTTSFRPSPSSKGTMAPQTRRSSKAPPTDQAQSTPPPAAPQRGRPTPRRLTRSALRHLSSPAVAGADDTFDQTMVTAIEGVHTSPMAGTQGAEVAAGSRTEEPSSRDSSKSRLEVEERLTGRSSTASPVVGKKAPLLPSVSGAEPEATIQEVAPIASSSASSSGEDEDSSSDDDDDSASVSSSSSSSTLQDLLSTLRTKYAAAEAAASEAAAAKKGEEAFADGEEIVRFDDEDEYDSEADPSGAEAIIVTGWAVSSCTDPRDDGLPRLVVVDRDRRPHKLTDSEASLKRLSRPLTLGPLPALTSASSRPRPSTTSEPSRPSVDANGKGKGKAKASHDRFGLPPLEPLSKSNRSRPSQPLAFHDLPLVTSTPEIRREIQALRLHNSLDPKRFYKGKGGNGMKDPVPERMRFGYVVGSGMGPRVGGGKEGVVKKRSLCVLTVHSRVVDSHADHAFAFRGSLETLVEDEAAKAYAKKKFVGEIQQRGSSGGKNFYKGVKAKRQRR